MSTWKIYRTFFFVKFLIDIAHKILWESMKSCIWLNSASYCCDLGEVFFCIAEEMRLEIVNLIIENRTPQLLRFIFHIHWNMFIDYLKYFSKHFFMN